MMKYRIIAIFLTPLLLLSVLVFYTFWTDYTISIMVVIVWVSALLLRSAFPRRFAKKYVLYLVNFLVLFALLNVGTLLYDEYLDYKLAQFDIDGDTIFSPQEQTAEQQKYEMLVVGDVGRNFMPITSLFISFGSSFLLFCIVKLFGRRLMMGNTSAHGPQMPARGGVSDKEL